MYVCNIAPSLDPTCTCQYNQFDVVSNTNTINVCVDTYICVHKTCCYKEIVLVKTTATVVRRYDCIPFEFCKLFKLC